jgi:transposase
VGNQSLVITKAGDSYLRTLLVQGAFSVLIGGEKGLIYSVVGSVHWSIAEDTGAVVAIAAKTQGCAGHHCITVMISGCTQPAKARNNHLTCNR